jgi:hypothetical protein
MDGLGLAGFPWGDRRLRVSSHYEAAAYEARPTRGALKSSRYGRGTVTNIRERPPVRPRQTSLDAFRRSPGAFVYDSQAGRDRRASTTIFELEAEATPCNRARKPDLAIKSISSLTNLTYSGPKQRDRFGALPPIELFRRRVAAAMKFSRSLRCSRHCLS